MSVAEEVKPLPKGWRWALLGEVTEINPRRRTLDIPDTQAVTFVPMEAVDEYSGTVATPQVRTYERVKKGFTYFETGDVLFSKITPCMQNGKHFIAAELKTE